MKTIAQIVVSILLLGNVLALFRLLVLTQYGWAIVCLAGAFACILLLGILNSYKIK